MGEFENGPYEEYFQSKRDRFELTRLIDTIGHEIPVAASDEIYVWTKEKYPNGIEIEANAVRIEGEEPGIALSLNRHSKAIVAISGLNPHAMTEQQENYFAVVTNVTNTDNEEPKRLRLPIKESNKFTPSHTGEVLLTNKAAEQLGIEDGQPVIIEQIAQDPKTLKWKDL